MKLKKYESQMMSHLKKYPRITFTQTRNQSPDRILWNYIRFKFKETRRRIKNL